MRLPGEEHLSLSEGIRRAVGRTPDAMKDFGEKRKEGVLVNLVYIFYGLPVTLRVLNHLIDNLSEFINPNILSFW